MCGQPPHVLHGKVEGTDFRWGASVSYSCVDGFQPSHSAILSCEGHGVWKGEVPQCLRKSSGSAGSWGPMCWTHVSAFQSLSLLVLPREAGALIQGHLAQGRPLSH